jgi:ABC-2 type transport system ATP-binding protein
MGRIVADHIWKQFQLRHDRADSVAGLLWQMVPGRRSHMTTRPFWALQDISFVMEQGDSVGIIGQNGSGKSTLLKILSRTMRPTQGQIEVSGRVSGLIELGAGFHPDFTGRENVILNASILGIRRKEIEKKMDEIIDFAEIPGFMDTPVKYYSSGMNARLGFAVATSVEPEILIVDEVLAVGDEAFQQKCMDRIFRMKRSGVSVLLVSHGLDSIERLMNKAVWIDKSIMRASGNPRDVVRAYREDILGQSAPSESMHEEADGSDETVLELVQADVATDGTVRERIMSGSRLTINTQWNNRRGMPWTGHLEFVLRRPDGLEVLNISTLRDLRPMQFSSGSQTISLNIPELWLTSGRYEVDGSLLNEDGRRLQMWQPMLSFEVQAMEKTPGLLAFPHAWQVD